MIFIVRIITVFVSSYSMNNSLIPYNTWWGILLWVMFFVAVLTASYLIYKKGDVLEKFLKRKTKKRKEKHNDI
jgi:choline-glycine betaine transporter